MAGHIIHPQYVSFYISVSDSVVLLLGIVVTKWYLLYKLGFAEYEIL